MLKPKRPGSRANATGRSEITPYVKLDYWMLDCPAYRGLRPVARALLVELARLYNGRNNGSIGLGERVAIERLNMSDRKAVRRAFNELEAAGFIVKTRAGAFSVKAADGRRASEWRLTWWPCGDDRPTKDFMRVPRVPGPAGEGPALPRGIAAAVVTQRHAPSR